jgi:hypothetical protein
MIVLGIRPGGKRSWLEKGETVYQERKYGVT